MAITRVQYRERQRLTAADLRFEQDYRLGMAGRHYLGPHEPAVVRGLRVIQVQPAGAFQLLPGVAIDGYGRELLVPQPVDLDIPGFDAKQCRYVYLYYCEDPEQSPPGRMCQDSPPPRIRQRTAVRVADSFLSPPDVASDLASARAAGAMAGADAWPVLMATIGRGCPQADGSPSPLIDYSLVTYVSHRAARVRAPTGNAQLQLGLTGFTDVYYFLVSTRDSQAALSKRLAIDRDHTLHVWKPLLISGANGTGEAMLAEGLSMRISMPMPAGLGRSLRIVGSVDPQLRALSASLVQIGGTAPEVRPVPIEKVSLAGRETSLPFAGFDRASVTLVDSARARPLTVGVARRKLAKTVREAAATGDERHGVAFSLQLERTGGRLTLGAAGAPAAAAAVACGDVARTRSFRDVPSAGVALMRPAQQMDADPVMREVHAVVTSAPTDPVAKTELRICGGAADDTDASSRLSLGKNTAGGYIAALRMDGAGRVRLLAGPDASNTQPLLEVDRTVYLPPIGKKDPMVTDLMALAYMSGLFQIGNVFAGFAIVLAPNSANGSTYDVTVNPPDATPYTVKRTVELIIGNDGRADMSVRVITEIPPGSTKVTANTKVKVPGLAPAGRKVRIVVLMLVKSGVATRIAYSAPLDLTIP